jgi:alpha-1,3-rhamnosyltransferase
MPVVVSVIALAYNSRKSILDTLESIRRQTYRHIELIIADDGSTDGTVQLVMEWLELHASSFRTARVIAAESNQGICANVAQGIEAATGDWLKLIACDDALREDAICKFVEIVNEQGTELAFSNMATFTESPSECDQTPVLFCDNDEMAATLSNITRLKRVMIVTNILPAPGGFFSMQLFRAAGGIDKRFKHLDDWPLWIRALPLVDNVSWIAEPLVRYRLSPLAVSQGNSSKAINAFLFDDLQKFRIYYQSPRVNVICRWDALLRSTRDRITLRRLGNSPRCHKLMSVLLVFSPLTYAKLARRLTNLSQSRVRSRS